MKDAVHLAAIEGMADVELFKLKARFPGQMLEVLHTPGQ